MIEKRFPILKDLDNKNKMSVFIFVMWMCCVAVCFVPYNFSIGHIIQNVCNVSVFTILFVVVGDNARIEAEIEGLRERLGL